MEKKAKIYNRIWGKIFKEIKRRRIFVNINLGNLPSKQTEFKWLRELVTNYVNSDFDPRWQPNKSNFNNSVKVRIHVTGDRPEGLK